VSTKLALKVFHTQMVALFFASVALGTAMAGVLAKFYDENNEVPYFSLLGGIAIAIGVALAALTPVLRRLMDGVR
jgi:POT family proton-dependent oligopeptide transporter